MKSVQKVLLQLLSCRYPCFTLVSCAKGIFKVTSEREAVWKRVKSIPAKRTIALYVPERKTSHKKASVFAVTEE